MAKESKCTAAEIDDRVNTVFELICQGKFEFEIYKEVAKEIHKINFIKLFVDKSRYSYGENIKEEAIPIIRELLVSRKFRMDYTHYKTKAILPTEVLEEETILEN